MSIYTAIKYILKPEFREDIYLGSSHSRTVISQALLAPSSVLNILNSLEDILL